MTNFSLERMLRDEGMRLTRVALAIVSFSKKCSAAAVRLAASLQDT